MWLGHLYIQILCPIRYLGSEILWEMINVILTLHISGRSLKKYRIPKLTEQEKVARDTSKKEARDAAKKKKKKEDKKEGKKVSILL